MTVTEKINKAKMGLVMTQPFYASLIFETEFIEDASIKTCCINGKLIKYNPDFFDSLTRDEMIGVFAHEILHVAYLHHTRRGKRNAYKWNVAADYAINSLLLAEKFILPGGRLYDELYEGMCAEEIYRLLPDSDENEDDPGNCGVVQDAPDNTSEEVIQATIIQASYIAQAQHKCPEYIKRLIKEGLTPKVNWRDALSQFLSSISKSDYSWLYPNKRYLNFSIYLPGLRSEELGNVILIIDTSGSIDDEMIGQFSAEVQEILSLFKISLTVIYCDDLVRSVQFLEPDESIKLEPHGGGGTDFIPAFTYIEEHELEPCALVYLTDGYCNSFPHAPDYPVLWGIYSFKDFKPPFGDTIRVEN